MAFNAEREGYLDQRHQGYYIERYITRGHRQVPSQLKQQFQAMLTIRQVFTLEIMLPLIEAIFQQLNISNYFSEVATSPDYTLSLIYYPPGDFAKERLASHRDAAVMTTLWTQASGYRANFQGQWQAIMPHDDYVIVQIGKGLALMTGEHCHAIEHDVTVAETIERFSMASFLALLNEAEFRDYVNNRLLSSTFIEYVKEDIAKTYKKK